MTEAIVYFFLFLALFFEVFIVLSFFEKDARRRRGIISHATFPSVTIIVPCFNEEKTVAATVESLLHLEYPKEKLALVLVNDGSTDKTKEVMNQYANHPQVKIIHKKNGGKHTALNAGIKESKSTLVGCLDADSFVEPDALMRIVPQFDHEHIGAVTASISVFMPKTILEHMQQAEYLFGAMLRHVLATVNGLHVTPGPFTIFRRSVFQEVGLFRSAHNTEDMEIALRMQKAGWRIQNAPLARVYTKVPLTVRGLIKQRVRWTTGFLRNSIDYREIFGNPRYGVLGLMVLPLAVLSVFSGITLFLFFVFQTTTSLWEFAIRAREVPLSFTLQLPSFDIFFIPTNTLVFLAPAATLIALALIVGGARISRTKSRIGFQLIWYSMLFSFIAPLWLMRSVIDVLLGVRRSWR
jgi:cellulose synthase/poly-beta-1,6-N-acetylglucosamine synthase-like glycosyltransferase